jgi:hypothetical protein
VTRENLNAVLERLREDPEFLDQFLAEPDTALATYELTDSERAALEGEDAQALVDAGADPELARLFVSIMVDKCPQRSRS